MFVVKLLESKISEILKYSNDGFGLKFCKLRNLSNFVKVSFENIRGIPFETKMSVLEFVEELFVGSFGLIMLRRSLHDYDFLDNFHTKETKQKEGCGF